MIHSIHGCPIHGSRYLTQIPRFAQNDIEGLSS